jgi:opacity protein-like surface antigen
MRGTRSVVLFGLGLTLATGSVARSVARAEGTGDAGSFAPVAETAAAFGAVGQIALSLGATADEHFFFHKSGGNWQLQLAPAADYFLAPHLSVGGAVSYLHATGGAGTGTNASGTDRFGLAARAGYALGINERVSFWPLAGLAFDHASVNHNSSTNTWLTIYAPFLFHPAPHFFVGVGPSFRLSLSGSAGTEYGLDSMLGGWF